MRRLQLYLHTIRYLHPAQISSRLLLRARRAAREGAPRATRALRRRVGRSIVGPDAPRPALEDHPLSGQDQDEIRTWVTAWGQGTPTYLSRTERLGWPPDWAAPQGTQLWRYHLHYFDEAPLLAQGGHEARAVLRTVIADWLARVPCGDRRLRDPWHPYVVSLRLVNWLLALTYAPTAFEGLPAFTDSLREHAVFLQANLETDVGGNHLLKNLKALAFAAVCWPAWPDGRSAGRRFTDALTSQVLADGVHYERSPMYHLQVLGDALELMLLHGATRAPLPEGLAEVTQRMVGALAKLTHPDGEIALLSDSALGMTLSAREAAAVWAHLSGEVVDAPVTLRLRPLVRMPPTALSLRPDEPAAIEPPGPLVVQGPTHRATHSGIVRLDSPRLRLIADVGALCPDELPAHAQADTFTFELSVDGMRLIVDAGVDEYAPGPWRAYYRSTRAHNTIEVDGEDSSECWGSFRAARRARVTDAALQATGSWRVLVGQHDGYQRLPQPVSHRRTFAMDGSSMLVVHDRLAGRGRHQVRRFLHLHPDTTIDPGAGRHDLVLRRGTSALRLAWSDDVEANVISGATTPPQGWYGDRFGGRRAAPVLVWSSDVALPWEGAMTLQAIDLSAPDLAPLRVDRSGIVHDGDRVITPPRPSTED